MGGIEGLSGVGGRKRGTGRRGEGDGGGGGGGGELRLGPAVEEVEKVEEVEVVLVVGGGFWRKERSSKVQFRVSLGAG